MTDLQFERWKDFAARMATVCYAASWRPSGAWVLDQVESFLDCVDPESYGLIESWDYSRDRPDDPTGRPELCMSDWVSEYFEDFGLPDIDENDCGRFHERMALAWEQYDAQWLGPVRCCLRAGLDCAAGPSCGVMGFTAGDIRKMYPEGVPEWVYPADEQLTMQRFTGVVPGIGLIPGERRINGTFAQLADSQELWL